jgi:hypothetical protein
VTVLGFPTVLSRAESKAGSALNFVWKSRDVLERRSNPVGLGSTKNLTPYLRSLEQKKLISSREVLGRTIYLVHDPRVGLKHLVDEGTISGEELDAVNELCSDLGQASIVLTEQKASLAKPFSSEIISDIAENYSPF